MKIINRNSYLLLALVVFIVLAYLILRSGLAPSKLLLLLFVALLLGLPLRSVRRLTGSGVTRVRPGPTFVMLYSRF